MGKVKVTQEQANAIEKLKNEHLETLKSIFSQRENYCIKDFEKPLLSLTPEQYHNALYQGYEVELKFDIGELTKINNDELEIFREILDIYTVNGTTYADLESADQIPIRMLIKFSQEEIAQEKERRFWARHNRDVLEIEQGDILMGKHRELYEVTADPKSHRFSCYTGNDSYDFDIVEFKRDNWKVVCFAEDRKDLSDSK